jgi:hypothetical protein
MYIYSIHQHPYLTAKKRPMKRHVEVTRHQVVAVTSNPSTPFIYHIHITHTSLERKDRTKLEIRLLRQCQLTHKNGGNSISVYRSDEVELYSGTRSWQTTLAAGLSP